MRRVRSCVFASLVVLLGTATAFAETPPEEPPPEPDYSGFWETLFDWLMGPYDELFDLALCALISAACWVVYVVVEAFFLILEELADVWPDMGDHAEAIAAFVNWVRLANAWLPLDWGFGMLFSYLAFVSFVVLVKWILKLIPTIG